MGGPLNGGVLRVGVVGAGVISRQYSTTVHRLPQLRITAVTDVVEDRARELADDHAARVLTLPGLLAADDVDVVLNLTLPATHAQVSTRALAAGKHVYGEKPLALELADGVALVEDARTRGLRVGSAPDTVLGTGIQTARAVLDAGRIGAPHAATAFMTTPGHERWHPHPDFYYQPGGGPLLDMGPYYLTALVHLLGPVARVVGAATRSRDERTIGTGPRAGLNVPVTVDTHTVGILEHSSGAVSTLLMSFDTWAARLPRIEVYGTEGSLSVPDPNRFDGTVELFAARTAPEPGSGRDPAANWELLQPLAGYLDAGRGYGLADLASALVQGRAHRANDEVALHVLDVMTALQRSVRTSGWETTSTTCRRPDAVAGVVDLVSPVGAVAG